MDQLPRISETEWEIMRVVWSRNPISAAEIIECLIAQDPTWHPVTAKTLLNRLVKKGVLGYDMEGRSYLYRPLVRERDCVNAASSSFLQRVFGGSLNLMVAHFVEHRKLNAKQIKELRRILDGPNQVGMEKTKGS